MDLDNLTWGLEEDTWFERVIKFGPMNDRYINHIDRVTKLVNEACRTTGDFIPYMVEISYNKHQISTLKNARSSNLLIPELFEGEYDEEFIDFTEHKGLTSDEWCRRFNELIEKDKTEGFIDYFYEIVVHFKAKMYMKEAVPGSTMVREWSPSEEQLKDEAGDYESYGIIEATFKNDTGVSDHEAWALHIRSNYNIWYDQNEGIEEMNTDVAEANSKLLKEFLFRFDRSTSVQLGAPLHIEWPHLKRPGYLVPAFKEIVREDLKRFPDAIEDPTDLD